MALAQRRPYKGRSLLTFPNDYVVIDLETTGLDPTEDQIIEIAAIHGVNGNIVDRFETLVDPGIVISDHITSITGITNEMVLGAPDLCEILPKLLSFIGKNTVVGHNVNFDINFLYDACNRLGFSPFSNNYVDTYRLSRRLCPEAESHRLVDLAERYGLLFENAHSAMGDVLMTNDCLAFLKIDEDAPAICTETNYRNHVTAKSIVACKNVNFDNPYLFKKTFVFTGTLLSMIRSEAMQAVVNNGGYCADSVSKKVNYLVVGNPEYITAIHGGKSKKLQRAEELCQKGFDVKIISENVFLDMLHFSCNEEGECYQ